MAHRMEQYALLIDFENFLTSIDSDNSLALIPELISSIEQQFGRIVYRKAFADWSGARLRKICTELQKHAVEMQHVPKGQANKKDIDNLLQLQAVLVASIFPKLSGIVIASAEGNYLTLVQQLKVLGMTVIGVGPDGKANSSWSKHCDEYLVCCNNKVSTAKSSKASKASKEPTEEEKNAAIELFKELIPANGILLHDLENLLKEKYPDFNLAAFSYRSLLEFLQSIDNQFKFDDSEDGIMVSSQEKNASSYTLQELQSFSFAEYMQATRWYILDGNIRDRVLHNIYALFEDSGRVLTNEELRNLVDPEHIVEERPWYGTIFSLVYGACLWENPEDSSIPLPRRHLSLFRTVKSEEEFLIRYYTSLFHKAYTERPDLSAQICAELMHPDDVEGHIPLYERVLEELSKRK